MGISLYLTDLVFRLLEWTISGRELLCARLPERLVLKNHSY